MKNWHLPFFRMRIDCLISKSCQLHAKTKQKRNKEASIYAGRVEVVWMVIETASSSRSCMSNGLALDKLNLCAYLGLALFSIGFCIPANLLYVVKIYFTPFFCICFFSIWNKFALDKLNLHFMWAKSICMQTLELVYQFSSKYQLLVFFLTN